MNLRETKSDVIYHAVEHTPQYQPPTAIAENRARFREVKLSNNRIRFYFGSNRGTRINFEHNRIWYHITKGDQGMDGNGNHRNLFQLLDNDSNNDTNFVIVD